MRHKGNDWPVGSTLYRAMAFVAVLLWSQSALADSPLNGSRLKVATCQFPVSGGEADKLSVIQDLLLAPVLVLVVAEGFHSRATLAEPKGIDAYVVAGGVAVLAHAFQPQRVLARLGPEVHQVELPQVRLGLIEVERLADLDAVENRLPGAVVVGSRQLQQ